MRSPVPFREDAAYFGVEVVELLGLLELVPAEPELRAEEPPLLELRLPAEELLAWLPLELLPELPL